MYTDIFKTFSDQTSKTFEPFTKYNKLVAKNVEAMTELQLSAIRTYSELGLNQMKAASEVKDISSLTEFGAKQLTTMTKLSEQMMSDSSKVQDMAKEFKEELDTLTAENMKAANPA